jgi:hypothetical protein
MKTKRKLLYRIAPHNGGLVFAPPSRARFVARIHEAIASAENWEQFPHLMPRKAYSEVLEIAFDDNGEPRTRGRDPFSGEMVPGWSDGDYPPWLQREMDHVVPEEVLVPRCRCSKTVSGRYRYRCRCRWQNRGSRKRANGGEYDPDHDNAPPRRAKPPPPGSGPQRYRRSRFGFKSPASYSEPFVSGLPRKGPTGR